jgi:hypothetical protein
MAIVKNSDGTFTLSASEMARFQQLDIAAAKQKEYRSQRNQKPEVKAKQAEYHRERYHQTKAEIAKLKALVKEHGLEDELVGDNNG